MSQCFKCWSLVWIDIHIFNLKVDIWLFILLLIVKMLYFRNYATVKVMPVKMYVTSAKSSWMALIVQRECPVLRGFCAEILRTWAEEKGKQG